MNELALFAGVGGGILGGKLLGWLTVCAVENNPYAASVLVARQNDGSLPPFPVWDDVRTFDGLPWRGVVDMVSGGFPCQDISVAGKGAGIDGERSGLWGEMARIVGEVRPRFVFVENSPMLCSRGLGRVLGDLAALGFDAEWCVLGADDTIFHSGNPCAYHVRKRIWVLGYSERNGRETRRNDNAGHDGAITAANGEHPVALADTACLGRTARRTERAGQRGASESGGGGSSIPDPDRQRQPQQERGVENERRRTGDGDCQIPDPYDTRREEQRLAITGATQHPAVECGGWWDIEPAVGRVAHGVANRVDRLKAIGNGQVPDVAALAFKTLYARLNNSE